MAKLVAGRYLNIAGHQFSKKRFSAVPVLVLRRRWSPDEVKCSGQPPRSKMAE